MNQNSLKPGEKVAMAACLAIMVLRAFSLPFSDLWRDWITLLCAFGTLSLFATTTRAREVLTVIFGLFLAIVYAWGQLPHSLAALGLA